MSGSALGTERSMPSLGQSSQQPARGGNKWTGESFDYSQRQLQQRHGSDENTRKRVNGSGSSQHSTPSSSSSKKKRNNNGNRHLQGRSPQNSAPVANITGFATENDMVQGKFVHG